MPSEETEMNITIRIAITFTAIWLAAHFALNERPIVTGDKRPIKDLWSYNGDGRFSDTKENYHWSHNR